MLSTLGVCQIRPVILVNCQTQAALEAADMVLEEVWILVEVDGLQRELSKTLTTVCIGGGSGSYTAAAKLGTRAILLQSVYVYTRNGDDDAVALT